MCVYKFYTYRERSGGGVVKIHGVFHFARVLLLRGGAPGGIRSRESPRGHTMRTRAMFARVLPTDRALARAPRQQPTHCHVRTHRATDRAHACARANKRNTPPPTHCPLSIYTHIERTRSEAMPPRSRALTKARPISRARARVISICFERKRHSSERAPGG